MSEKLEVGKSIIILRKDGRKHSAIVSNVDDKVQTVTVEWYENGETKGKEIEFVNVYALNPHIKADSARAKEGITPLPSNLSLPAANPKNVSNRTIMRNGRLSAISTKNAYGNCDKVTSQVSVNIHSNAAKFRMSRMSLVPPPSLSETNITKRNARPSVVVEVEKLKKNREERRQRQAEVREEQKAIMNFYPKNSNWKFGKMITDYQSTLEFKPLVGTEMVESRQITVCVRKRPLNRREVGKSEIDVISVPKKNLIIVHEPKNKVDLTKYLDNQHFYFDYVFDEKCTNEVVYKYTAKPLIETIFDGGMATCFAYGQTGSGKTYTMGGTFSGKKQDLENGIYVMAARDVFGFLNSPRYQHQRLMVTSTFFEIYQGKVFDLLAKKARLRVLEDGKQQVQVVGLTEKAVTSLESVLALLQEGNSARASGKTTANSNSSRSHAVFQIILRYVETKKLYGKFSLIDLAGNERGVDTSTANKTTQMEGAEINKSLLALKECIRALGRKGAHLPFRQSKLTQVLRDSFVGEKSKMCMIAMISPGMCSCEHTLNTLRYADRVKELVPNDVEENESVHLEESKNIIDIQPNWDDINQEITKNFFVLEQDSEYLQDKLMMDISFREGISRPLSELSNQEAAITNLL
ncbi:kinesin-like protein Klp10A [Rhodnius prolixus]|uniref:Kinesin-like protein n=1 Tax=Rhodnius prolixus TaxID=13249 RepID=T1HB93_RHOPR